MPHAQRCTEGISNHCRCLPSSLKMLWMLDSGWMQDAYLRHRFAGSRFILYVLFYSQYPNEDWASLTIWQRNLIPISFWYQRSHYCPTKHPSGSARYLQQSHDTRCHTCISVQSRWVVQLPMFLIASWSCNTVHGLCENSILLPGQVAKWPRSTSG